MRQLPASRTLRASARQADSQWRSRAACRSVDAEIFFPAATEGPIYEAQVAVAKAVCAGCSVRAECLAEALVRIPYGIAGGLTPEERRGRHATDQAHVHPTRSTARSAFSSAGCVPAPAGRRSPPLDDCC